MSDALCEAVRRYTDHHADAAGIATTPVRGLYLVRATSAGALEHALARPLVCLILQGAKRVVIGERTVTFSAGESMIVTADVPTVSRIIKADAARPYLAIALDLDSAVIAELETAMKAARAPMAPAGDDVELRDAMLRLIRLLERPGALSVLVKPLVREIHYWLLLGARGDAIRDLGLPDSHVRRVARAVAVLYKDFARPVTIEELADTAGMSRSAFHKHFRAVTSLSPLQFQKQLRLIEARRLMLAEGKAAGRAAFDVGYASVSQFSREYARMFGLPPARDRRAGAATAHRRSVDGRR